MQGYVAFLKKEFCELSRTYRLLILGCVFLLFGFLSPLTAKLTPQLLESLADQGIQISIPDPTALDSWTQFHKNVSQMGFLVLIILFGNTISGEYAHGTLINLVTRGLSRTAVILAKFTSAVTAWTLSLIVCFGVTYGYTAYLWQDETVPNLLFAAACLWLVGALLLSIAILGGTLFPSVYGTLLFTGGVAVAGMLPGSFTDALTWNPARLASDNLQLLTADLTPMDFLPAILVTVGSIALCLALASQRFRKLAL